MSWTKHNETIDSQSLPPAETLLQTLKIIESENITPGQALDLGSGAGIDTMALLQQGWQVTAVDKDEASIHQLRQKIHNKHLRCINASFEEMELQSYQLINASFSLPFCPPSAFDNCWQKITASLEKNGYFCGHFFGENDSWNTRQDITTITKFTFTELFKDFQIAWQKEIEKDVTLAGGQLKHWHIFAVSARKL